MASFVPPPARSPSYALSSCLISHLELFHSCCPCLVCVAVINIMTRSDLGRKGFMWLRHSNLSQSLREVGAEAGRNYGGTLLTVVFHVLLSSRSLRPRPCWGRAALSAVG